MWLMPWILVLIAPNTGIKTIHDLNEQMQGPKALHLFAILGFVPLIMDCHILPVLTLGRHCPNSDRTIHPVF